MTREALDPSDATSLSKQTQELSWSCDSLVNTATRKQLVNAFICSQMNATQAQADEEVPWIMTLPDLTRPTKALDVTSLALCTVRLGRENRDDVLIHEGLRLYTRGLRELQTALWDPQLMYQDETLGAAMLLAMYEIFECPGKSHLAYETHSSGCATLVRLRGPAAHRFGFAHEIFRAFRITGILQGMRFHKTTFLNDPAWRETPFEISGKSQFDKIIDIFAALPGIWERADTLQALKSAELLCAALELVDECWAMDAVLQEFYDNFANNRRGPLYWPEMSTEDNPADDPVSGNVFPVAFKFVDISTARILLMFWAAELMLEVGLWLLYKYIPTMEVENERIATCCKSGGCDVLCSCKFNNQASGLSQFNVALLRPLEHRADFFKTAAKICQSFEYCMESQMLTMGPTAMGTALSIVIENLKILPEHARALEWARAAFDKIKKRGVRILEYMQYKT